MSYWRKQYARWERDRRSKVMFVAREWSFSAPSPSLSVESLAGLAHSLLCHHAYGPAMNSIGEIKASIRELIRAGRLAWHRGRVRFVLRSKKRGDHPKVSSPLPAKLRRMKPTGKAAA